MLNEVKDKQIISTYLDIDYEVYKNKIKIIMLNHINLIYKIFTEDFSDNFVKLFILYKKQLLESQYRKYVKSIINFYNYLENLSLYDQEEYFCLILKLLNVYSQIINLKIDNSNKYIKLIEVNLINEQIIKCVELISKENTVIELIVLFINKKNTQTKNNIIYVGERLSFDMFVYYSGKELFLKIIYELGEKNNLFVDYLKKYKKDFILSYKSNSQMLRDLYFEQNLEFPIVKYLLEIPQNIKEVAKDLSLIKKELKK